MKTLENSGDGEVVAQKKKKPNQRSKKIYEPKLVELEVDKILGSEDGNWEDVDMSDEDEDEQSSQKEMIQDKEQKVSLEDEFSYKRDYIQCHVPEK